jgi:NAD-dependent dihydropyrimidine dehydrogenase PreA subunit
VKIISKKKSLIISSETHQFSYKYPNSLTLTIQRIVSYATKKYFDDVSKNAIVEHEDGRKTYSLKIYTRFNWLYKILNITSKILRRLPRKLYNSLLNRLKRYGLDLTVLTMTTLPQERFKTGSSFVFVPDSKENELKTSDGKIVLPHLLIIEMLKRVCAYDPDHSIAKGHYCVCRKTFNCKNHPHDISCLIVGPGAVDVVERGMGRYISLDETINFIKNEVMTRRLSGFIAIFALDLHYYWGVKSRHSKYTFEICSCCPCCCVMKKPHFFLPRDPIENMEPFIDIRGFKAKIDLKKCSGIGECVTACPLHRIRLVDMITKDGKKVKKATNKDCLGCGYCVPYCPNNAIEIVATESFDHLEDLLGIFEYYDLKKEDLLVKLNKKYREINKKLI